MSAAQANPEQQLAENRTPELTENRTEKFARAIAVLETGVGRPMTAEQVELYYQLLGDIPLEILELAVARALAELTFPAIPPVGTLRRLADEALHGCPLTAGEAWGMVRKAVRDHGYYAPVRGKAMLPGLVREALDAIGGWNGVCDAPLEAMATLSAQFRKSFEALAEREETRRRLPGNLRPALPALPAPAGQALTFVPVPVKSLPAPVQKRLTGPAAKPNTKTPQPPIPFRRRDVSHAQPAPATVTEPVPLTKPVPLAKSVPLTKDEQLRRLQARRGDNS